jgi:hypothetical protein
LPEEEKLMASIGERQCHSNRRSPREARDFPGDLFERRTRQERTFTRDSLRGFRKRKSEELLVSVGVAKETQRTEVRRASVREHFNELAKVLPRCMISNQILNMDHIGQADLQRRESSEILG